MMNKILLIEDRITRQELYLSKFKIDLDAFEILENIKGGQRFTEIKKQISIANNEIFESFSSIIAHRSALEQSEREFLYTYCAKKKKPLAFFSGGISSISYSENNEFQFLSINSNDFYSPNLPFFLNEAENDNLKLVHLAFGQNWELNVLLNFTTTINRIRHEKALDVEKLPSQLLSNKIGLDNSILPDLLIKYKILPNWYNETLVNKPIEAINELYIKINEILLTETLK